MPTVRIGLDFDNTLVDYDIAFPQVANLIGVNTQARSKRALRDELLKSEEGELLWQKIQGLTYGIHIDKAVIQPGALEFVWRARVLGHELFIISHKTEFGHHDPTKTSLRTAALDWLLQARIAGDQPLQIPTSHIHFASTREEKIHTIGQLELDVFVDDLREVLENRGFPPRVRRYWFTDPEPAKRLAPNNTTDETQIIEVCSWREIGAEILGEPTDSQIESLLTTAWVGRSVNHIERIQGRGNSRIYRIARPDATFALKVYPDRREDSRPRREQEWTALTLLSEAGFAVPKPITTFSSLNWSVIEWIDGAPADPTSPAALKSASLFVEQLTKLSRSLSASIGNATEACLRPSTIRSQIEERILRLEVVGDASLSSFLIDEVRPALQWHVERAERSLGTQWDTDIDRELQILSPSDFGFHNCLETQHRGHIFFDLEYFGWDDPVKLVSDFALHPGFKKTAGTREWWLKSMRKVFVSDPSFDLRLGASLPLYAIRWSLITLNEFLSDKSRNRVFARANVEADLKTIQRLQLEKARKMIQLHASKNAGFLYGTNQ